MAPRWDYQGKRIVGVLVSTLVKVQTWASEHGNSAGEALFGGPGGPPLVPHLSRSRRQHVTARAKSSPPKAPSREAARLED